MHSPVVFCKMIDELVESKHLLGQLRTGAEIGCRGGNRYFEGVRGFLEIPKVQKMGFP